MKRNLEKANERIHEHEELLDTLIDLHPPRATALIETRRRRGDSIPKITEFLALADERSYNVTNFSRLDLDLGHLALLQGCSALVYSLNHGLRLPSIDTIRRHCSPTRVHPNFGPISDDTIYRNIRDIFLALRRNMEKVIEQSNDPDRVVPCRGGAIVIDDVAMEQEATYHSLEKKMGGGCFNCTKGEDTRMETQAGVESSVRRLEEGKMHLGKEMMEAALKVYGESGVSTLVAAPTCKSTTAAQMVDIFLQLIDAFKRSPVASRYVQLWTIVTDGDAVRRLAGFTLLMRHHLSEVDPELYAMVSGMEGFNYQTGLDGITIEFDWKHIWKRKSSLVFDICISLDI